MRNVIYLVPALLFLLALAVRIAAASDMPFPTTEPSAYYVSVAGNLLAGEGLVSNGVWSYATPPLEVPKPAFELWLPMSTFVSAAAMSVLGSTFWAAQVGNILLGSLIAPLAWAIGREAARAQGLDARRGGAVAIASGLLGAVLAPLVLASVVPDSYTPFTVFILAGALLIPRVLGVRDGLPVPGKAPSVLGGVALGAVMGLAYLSRQEVIWLGLTFVVMLWWALRSRPGSDRRRESLARLWPVVAGGLIVVVPWLTRNAIDLGTPLPGQAIDNMFLIENEDIFAFNDPPEAAAYLGQGLITVLANPLVATWRTFLEVIALPPFPVGILGLISLVGLRRSPAIRRPTALQAVLISGALAFVSTMLMFPVATLWGTFLHSSGPLMVGLGVAAALGGDTLLARISAARQWEKPNVILAPIALLAVAGILAVFQVRIFSEQSQDAQARYAALADEVRAVAAAIETDVPATIISDHPMWVADALDRNAVALPDEDLDSMVELAGLFEAPWVIVVGERGRYPDLLLQSDARACLAADPIALDVDTEPAWLFRLDTGCMDP